MKLLLPSWNGSRRFYESPTVTRLSRLIKIWRTTGQAAAGLGSKFKYLTAVMLDSNPGILNPWIPAAFLNPEFRDCQRPNPWISGLKTCFLSVIKMTNLLLRKWQLHPAVTTTVIVYLQNVSRFLPSLPKLPWPVRPDRIYPPIAKSCLRDFVFHNDTLLLKISANSLVFCRNCLSLRCVADARVFASQRPIGGPAGQLMSCKITIKNWTAAVKIDKKEIKECERSWNKDTITLDWTITDKFSLIQ